VPFELRFDRLRRRFGPLTVLRGVSGRVGPGEVLLVSGANGSGKSTLLRCLAGLMAADSGTIDYREPGGLRGDDDSGPALSRAERRQRVGYLAPDLAFYDDLTCLENLTFFAGLRGVPARRAVELLDRVGLPHDRTAGALSSGMRQRLRWAWALLHRPRLLLLDEPFQNLDAPGEATAREMLAEHLANTGDGAHGMGAAVVADPSGIELPGVASRVAL
jgi:heme exporter protein A